MDASYGQREERLVLPPLPPRAASVVAQANAAYGASAAAASGAQDGAALGGDAGLGVGGSGEPAAGLEGARGAFIVRLPCGPSDEYLR